MTQDARLDKIAICLVDPTYAGNVGSVARAMCNTGLSRLILVGGVDVDDEMARKMASGNYHVIENALHVDTLEEAIAPFNLVVGTSRRTGKTRRPTHTVRGFAETFMPMMDDNEMVIVFGREKHGLTSAELALCQHRVYIPTHQTHGSLNLSQAVMIVTYELFMTVQNVKIGEGLILAKSDEIERMYEHMRTLLLEVGFLSKENPEWMIRAFRLIFGRAGLDSRDIRIIRGMFSDYEWYLDHCLETGKRDGHEKT